MSRGLVFRLATSLLSVSLALVVLEGLVRLVVPAARWRFRDASADWRPDAELGWVQRANLDVVTLAEDGARIELRTNQDGLQPATARRERSPGRFRVLIVGDSTVVGRAVPEEARIHRRLEAELRAAGLDAEVLNAGVEGYSTDQSLLRLAALAPLYRPDLVLYGFCHNDIAGNSSATAYGVAKPGFRRLADSGLEKSPPAFEAASIPGFGSGPRKWLQHSALYRLAQPALVTLRARLGGWQERGLAGIGEEIYFESQALEQGDWPLFAGLLAAMARESARHGAGFLFYSHPALGEVWEPEIAATVRRQGLAPESYNPHALERRLAALAGEEAIRFCPLIETFRRQQERGPFHLLPRDPHCNATGYAVTAEALASCAVEPSPKMLPPVAEGKAPAP